MSFRSEPVSAESCVALAGAQRQLDAYPNRELTLGDLTISRALPVKDRRLVGPWCFLDRFGPLTFTDGKPMDVAPHPHIGLQTVTWLLDGEVVHDDSLGCQGLLRPGGINVMTSGSGIAHAEQTPRDHGRRLDGVQLWVALPDTHRQTEARFEHVEAPAIETNAGIVRVFAGTLCGAASPASYYSDLVGADLLIHPQLELAVGLNPTYEHALLVLNGDCSLEGLRLEERTLYYLGTRRSDMALKSTAGSRVLLVGGPPFPETILMWWNFVARTPEEIAEARADWETHRRFGDVAAYRGPRLSAPELTRFARPNPVS